MRVIEWQAVHCDNELCAGGKEAVGRWKGEASVFDKRVTCVEGKQNINVVSETSEDLVSVKYKLKFAIGLAN